MRLLIFGAGVLGTFYAAKLQARGHDVTVLARGHRAVQVRDHGLVIQERGRGCLRARVRAEQLHALVERSAGIAAQASSPERSRP